VAPDSRSDNAAIPSRIALHPWTVFVPSAAALPIRRSQRIVMSGGGDLSFGKQEKKLGWHTQPTAMVLFA
jgi:hypothetical protein